MSKSAMRQFSELPNPIETFERVFRSALVSLLDDLADAPWFVREHEVVNLFVFSHLIPQFQSDRLDIAQIGIEVPVLHLPNTAREKPGTWADIAVWAHNKATVWRTCRPLARIEWKNISCREKRTAEIQRQHRKDVDRLKHDSALASINYAVLTKRTAHALEMRCERILNGEVAELFEPLQCAPAGDDNTLTTLGYRELLSREQGCPDCVGHNQSRVARANGKRK